MYWLLSIYQLLFTAALPLVWIRFQWRGRKAPLYKERFQERLGILNYTPQKPVIWFHTVSLGEAIAAAPLIKATIAELKDYEFVVTATTATGSERIQALFGDTVTHVYLPLDLPFAVNRFYNTLKPKLGVILETEIWPTLLLEAKRRHIPMILVNARLNEKSRYGYLRFKQCTKEILSAFSLILAQSKMDLERYASLDYPTPKLILSGNLKFDLHVREDAEQLGSTLRASWGEKRPVWIAASTHEGEEKAALDAHKRITQDIPNAILLLVPRHPERFNRAAELIEAASFSYVRRSESAQGNKNIQVYLCDTIGEMPIFYAASDVAFLGGSLVPVGGHNLLEPAAQHLALLTGPILHNFKQISELLLEADGLTIVNNDEEIAANVIQLFQNKELMQKRADAAESVVINNKGALKRTLAHMKSLL